MDALVQVLGIGPENTSTWIAALVVFQALVLLALLAASWSSSALRSKWNRLLRGSEGKGVIQLLEEHLHKLNELEESLLRLQVRLDALEDKLARSARRVGLVKYDAFEDVGGEQSFALAFTDDDGNGALLTGLLGRQECRVFAKSLKQGQAGLHLTPEEKEAIEVARRWD